MIFLSNFIFMKGFKVLSKEDRKKQQEREGKKMFEHFADPFHQFVHQAFNTLYAIFTVS